jgi:homocysteine S-methyltransferase
MTTSTFPAIMVIDGGLATELERRGADLSGPLWSAHTLLEQPALVEEVHAAYLAAGADCLITSSYQISFEGFERAGLSAAETIQALEQSTAVADAARRRFERQSGRPVWIAASLGPFGATLHDGSEYHGRYDLGFDDLVEMHRSRLEHLQRGPIDLVACETVPSLEEARAMLRALAAFPHLSAWLAFTCADARSTGAGDDIADGAQLAATRTRASNGTPLPAAGLAGRRPMSTPPSRRRGTAGARAGLVAAAARRRPTSRKCARHSRPSES